MRQIKLIPFIKKYHINDDAMIFWPDLARAHYSKEVLTYFDETSVPIVPIVPKTINPPNIPQGRPIEDFWGVLVQLTIWKQKQRNSWDVEYENL